MKIVGRTSGDGSHRLIFVPVEKTERKPQMCGPTQSEKKLEVSLSDVDDSSVLWFNLILIITTAT